jgi:hypothetical protein
MTTKALTPLRQRMIEDMPSRRCRNGSGVDTLILGSIRHLPHLDTAALSSRIHTTRM